MEWYLLPLVGAPGSGSLMARSAAGRLEPSGQAVGRLAYPVAQRLRGPPWWSAALTACGFVAADDRRADLLRC